MALFEIKPVDADFYRENLADFLPDTIIDIHTHVWPAKFNTPIRTNNPRTVTWPSRVAAENPIDHLDETYRLMFPDKKVTPLIFTTVVEPANLDQANNYVSLAAAQCNYPALIMAHPSWNAEELERRLNQGGFLGVKVYLSYAPSHIPGNDITIFDFLPPHQLALLNERHAVVMLHIPRSGRLKDPANLSQLLEIEAKYPNIGLIVAHVGRAYCLEDVGNAWQVLAQTKNMSFDFSANTNAEVFGQLIQAVGAKRILFGSDMPISRMRMKRVTENGIYINLVPRGLYGDVSNDKNMREIEPPQAETFTFFIYEEIAAFKQAALKNGLSSGDLEDIFCGNAQRLILRAKR